MIDKLMTCVKLVSYMGFKNPFIYLLIIISLYVFHLTYNRQKASFNNQPIYQITTDGKLLNKKLSKTLAPTGVWVVKPLNFSLKVKQITHQKNFYPVTVLDISTKNKHIQNLNAQKGYNLAIQNKHNLYIFRIEKIQYQPSLVTFSLKRLGQ